MAISSISATPFPSLSLSDSSSFSTKPKFSSISIPSVNALNFETLKPSLPPPRIYAAVESLESQETIDLPEETTERTGSEMVPKQKIRIKVRSYWVPLIEETCKKIMDAARNTNAKTMGPVPLPTKKRIYCLLKSPNGHKDARFHFEIRTHQRLIDILYPTAQTIDSLMLLDIPAGVDVKVKL